jgi:hypothetical protein
MLCTRCANEVPDGSPSCPRCGREFPPATPRAPANPTAFTPDTLSKEESARVKAFVHEQQRTFQQWRKRLKWIAWPVAFLAGVLTFFLLTLVVSHEGKYAGFLPMIFSIFIIVAGEGLLEISLLPKLIMPTLPCPYCARAFPLMKVPPLLKSYRRPAECPHCRRALPH